MCCAQCTPHTAIHAAFDLFLSLVLWLFDDIFHFFFRLFLILYHSLFRTSIHYKKFSIYHRRKKRWKECENVKKRRWNQREIFHLYRNSSASYLRKITARYCDIFVLSFHTNQTCRPTTKLTKTKDVPKWSATHLWTH